jgi:hypothetical protein
VTPDPIVPLVLRGALALLFAAAAAHKLRDRAGFRATLADYRLLPEATLGFAADALVALEAGLAAALLVPASAPAAAVVAAGLLVLYGAAIGANLARGRRHVACGCLGPAAEQPLHAGLLVRNGVLAAAALASSAPASARALGPTDAFTTVAAVATLALLYLAVDGLLAAARLAAPRRTP